MLKPYYNNINPEQYDARHSKSPREGYMRDHWHPLLVDAINKYCKDKTVLDLGCGTGVYTAIIAEIASSVLGIDQSNVMLDYAKIRHPELNLILADAHQIPLQSNSMDVVICIGLLEYVSRDIVIKEIKRVLKPKGICLIHCPNKFGAARMSEKAIRKILGKAYQAKEPSYEEMLKLFRHNGFSVMESVMDDGLIWLPDNLDRLLGQRLYLIVERFFTLFGRNPFSNVMQFIVREG